MPMQLQQPSWQVAARSHCSIECPQDPQRVALLRTLLADYSQTSPQVMQILADRYLAKASPFRLAIIPEGQSLAQAPAGGSGSNAARSSPPGR